MGIPSTETSRNAKGSILKRLGRAAVALVAATATLASGLIVAGSASADTLPPGATDSWTYGYWYNRDAPRGHFLGVEYYADGNPVYCIESGVQVTGQGTWSNATDPDHRAAAWMVEKHKGEKDNFTQAAVAYAIHSHIESNNGATFRELVASGLQGADVNAVAKRADALWDEAYASTPANAKMSYAYTNGKRTGTVNPGVLNRKGQYLSGIKYTMTLTGPAKFDQTGTNTISGTTTGQATHIPWTATGNGTVKAVGSWSVPRGAILNSPGQKLFRATDPETQTSDIQFQVQKDFQPTATTTVGHKELETGNPVTDTVTSGTATGDQWADNIPVTFKGYYFIGKPDGILKTVNRNTGETPTDYLKRLRNTEGIRQVASSVAYRTQLL